MKCTNNLRFRIVALLLSVSCLLTACGDTKYDMAYKVNNDVSSFQLLTNSSKETIKPFAADLCVTSRDTNVSALDLSNVGAAALFNLKNLDTLYSKNANERIHPASLTKVMTALVALKYGSPDQILTATDSVVITESGAQLCGLKPGDQMTLDQALHVLLIYSANDVAMLIAEGVGGTVAGFMNLMNKEAQELGATNCNFVNPNGLTDESHYVTAYDLYLIFQEALKYDLFNEIIQMNSYSTTFKDRNGADKSLEFETTNLYLRGTYDSPQNITIIGGKTGTTNAAGHCLMVLSRDSSGTPYISIIMKDTSRDELYADMTNLLNIIN